MFVLACSQVCTKVECISFSIVAGFLVVHPVYQVNIILVLFCFMKSQNAKEHVTMNTIPNVVQMARRMETFVCCDVQLVQAMEKLLWIILENAGSIFNLKKNC